MRKTVYIPVEKPTNCSDCGNWNCPKAKPKIPKDCPAIVLPSKKQALKIINAKLDAMAGAGQWLNRHIYAEEIATELGFKGE